MVKRGLAAESIADEREMTKTLGRIVDDRSLRPCWTVFLKSL
jgi:hypothetical protein